MRLALCIEKRDFYPETFCKDVTRLVHHLAADTGHEYFGTIFTDYGDDPRGKAKERGFTHALLLPETINFDIDILNQTEELCR